MESSKDKQKDEVFNKMKIEYFEMLDTAKKISGKHPKNTYMNIFGVEEKVINELLERNREQIENAKEVTHTTDLINLCLSCSNSFLEYQLMLCITINNYIS